MINDGNRIHLWNMWKRNFKSTQAYHQHKAKGGGLHIGISSLLEYEITQNASLRLIWSHTAFEQPLEWWRHQYPQHISQQMTFFCQFVTSCSLRVGVSESQNHELYYSLSTDRQWANPNCNRKLEEEDPEWRDLNYDLEVRLGHGDLVEI